MNDLRKAAERALDALEDIFGKNKVDVGAINALRTALAEPEQEPVAWELRMGKTDRVLMEITNNPERAQNWRASLCEVVPLYYAPTPRKPDLEALNAELVEALQSVVAWMDAPDESAFGDGQLAAVRAALAKAGVSK